MKKTVGLWMIALAAAALTSACAGTHATSKTSSAAGAGAAAPVNPPLTETGRAVDMEPNVRDANLRAIPELKTVNFAYNSDRLDGSALAVLRANADWLKSNPVQKVQVSGNCDQRGTVAYNLALGQKRANAVRHYYKALGIDASRIATISYGKERLLCTDMVESCWSRNRRADTLEVLEAKVAAP